MLPTLSFVICLAFEVCLLSEFPFQAGSDACREAYRRFYYFHLLQHNTKYMYVH